MCVTIITKNITNNRYIPGRPIPLLNTEIGKLDQIRPISSVVGATTKQQI